MPESEDRPAARPERADTQRARDARTGADAAASRIQHQSRWVELQIQKAMERGEFDNLPGKGKPLGDLGSPYDRDWWLKKLIEREQVSVLPAALQLRKDDAELDAALDREATAKSVRQLVEEFNRRIIEARRQLQGGPPVVTKLRDVDTEVERWSERRRRLAVRRSAEQAARPESARQKSRRRWFRTAERRRDG